MSLRIVKKSIQDFYMKEKILSINISMEDIQNRIFTNEIVKIAKEYKNLSNIIFEITESSDIKNYALVNSFIEKIKPYGIRIPSLMILEPNIQIFNIYLKFVQTT